MKRKLIIGLVLILLVALSFSNVYATDSNDEIAPVEDLETLADTTEGTWTDFSNAKVEVVKSANVGDYDISITGVTPIENHNYYYTVVDDNSTPEFSDSFDRLGYDSSKGTLYTTESISKYLELGPDQYLYVFEQYLETSSSEFLNKIVLNKVLLEKPEQKKYTEVFFSALIVANPNYSDCSTRITFNTPWEMGTSRKVQLKIGRITDNDILNGIKNGEATAFESLLNYAKNNTGIYNNILEGNRDLSMTAGGIKLTTEEPLINANLITNDAYYYLYAVVDDENGKYVKTEGVTLAQAYKSNKIANTYSLFFYGDDDFEWVDFEGSDNTGKGDSGKDEPGKDEPQEEEPPVDNTVAPDKIPQTGTNYTIFVVLAIIAIVSIILYKRFKKYDL